jgi:hypothetical protein
MTKIRNKPTQVLQEGGLIDEETLFDDEDVSAITDPLINEELTEEEETARAEAIQLQADEDAQAELDAEAIKEKEQGGNGDDGNDGDDGDDVELTGVEEFLTSYGVNGGIITFEDGTTSRFSELDSKEQNNILSSLVKESVPSIEEKFNLDEDEINLLNAVRESDMNSEEFINDLVNHRLQTVLATKESNSTDYKSLSQDAIFVKNLRDSDKDLTDEDVAEELVKAKGLSSYKSTVESMRRLYINDQETANKASQTESDKVFNQELEAQRHDIVAAIENINDIAGAAVTPEMKEFLLHDIMELNDSKDPILMEKIFSNPESMFKANWWVNYGEDYIGQLNTFWKKEVSKAQKSGYDKAAGKLTRNPTIIGSDGKRVPNKDKTKVGDDLPQSFGTVLTEDQLFEHE